MTADYRINKEPLRYLPSETIIPAGFTVKDLDWTATTWAVESPERYNRFFQIILTPGVILERSGFSDGLTWTIHSTTPKKIRKSFRQQSRENLMDVAMEKTEKLLNSSYQWKFAPLTFTVNPEGKSNWPDRVDLPNFGADVSVAVETLGDALSTDSEIPVRDVFNASISELMWENLK